MELLTIASQVIIAASIGIVWVFRFDNIIQEFEHFGLSTMIRSAVGAAKISLATLLVAGIWYPKLILISASGIAFLMVCALYAHFSVRNPLPKYLPAFALLCLCVFIVATKMDLI